MNRYGFPRTSCWRGIEASPTRDQHPALNVFLESVCLFLVAGETVLFENALREAAVAVNIH